MKKKNEETQGTTVMRREKKGGVGRGDSQARSCTIRDGGCDFKKESLSCTTT